MTDLEKRADEYAIKVAEKNVMPKDCFAEHLIRQAYLDATKAETALLSQHILDLQKDKGNLTDRVRELEQQIEKMKWHKIADGDIPKVTGDYITNIGVLTYDHYGNNIYKWHTPYCEACDYADEVGDDEVIAWCEIPKYTKEIKEK